MGKAVSDGATLPALGIVALLLVGFNVVVLWLLLRLRVQRGELVSRRAAVNLAVTFGRSLRDRLLTTPIRYGPEPIASISQRSAISARQI